MSQNFPHAEARRGFDVLTFRAVCGVGRSKAYDEIKNRRLRIRKIGRRTIITVEDAEAWFAACASSRAP